MPPAASIVRCHASVRASSATICSSAATTSVHSDALASAPENSWRWPARPTTSAAAVASEPATVIVARWRRPNARAPAPSAAMRLRGGMEQELTGRPCSRTRPIGASRALGQPHAPAVSGPPPRSAARPRGLAVVEAPQRVDQLVLAHLGAPPDPRRAGVGQELVLGLGRVDASGGAPAALAREAARAGRLLVGRPLLVLGLPMVAALLGDVLDRGPSGPVARPRCRIRRARCRASWRTCP